MSHTEQTYHVSTNMTYWEKTCRSLFISVLKKMPAGYMVIKENGAIVAELGNQHDDLKAEVNVLSPAAYPRLLLGGSIASGETFTDKLWDTPNLTNVIRIFARNLPMLDSWEQKFKWLTMPLLKLKHFANRNNTTQAKNNIAAHYDLGNKLYTKFLDDSMMYSAAIYPDANTSLAEAQQYKLKAICEKLRLQPEDHLVEIGTGWGGLAIYAAQHYQCQVTTTTISEEQYQFTANKIRQLGLENKITLLKQDYRSLQGKYSKLVSVEMIEAVGKAFLPTFFKKCQSLLSNNGIMLIQSIIIDDRRYDSYANSVDFIQKHIFPGGFLPSQYVLNKQIKKYTDMSIRDVHDIGLDYAQTLRDWFQAFMSQKNALNEEGYDERFMRMWQYYLNYCEGGFLERVISTVQLVMTKPGYLEELQRG
ncbi:class I SAM-dependent methyltransferase [Agaribacter flavus]|uniref:Class I SAM-dependent methyltransferase n=1 Tax=Agaribacter flavus TaxID=1902781 RepID=A0ABV7FUB1_9ALTE